MSEYVVVGLTGMRDPLTGELLNAVPLYVEVPENGEPPQIPTVDRKEFVREVGRKVKAMKAAKKENPADGADISGKSLP